MDFKNLKKQNEDQDETVKPEEETPKPVGYQGVFLYQVIKVNGATWKPDEFGCFVPSNEEEQALCDYYVSIDRMVKVSE